MSVHIKKYVVMREDEVFVERALSIVSLSVVKRNMIIKYGAGITVKEIKANAKKEN